MSALMKRHLFGVTALTGAAFLLAACSELRPQSTASRDLESGITSSNGGGMMPADFGRTDPVKVP